MIDVDRQTFSRALDMASTFINRRNTIPILSTVKVVANGRLSMSGCDLDSHAEASLAYTGDEAEFTLVEPRGVRAAIEIGAGKTVGLARSDDSKRVVVKSGPLSAELATYPADEFPHYGTIDSEEFGVEIGTDVLAQIARIMPAISTEETRYYLNGICMHRVDEWLWRCVATDGHRLMAVDIPLPGAVGDIADQIIIPRVWLVKALERFSKSKDAIRFSYGRARQTNQPDPTLEKSQPEARRISLRARFGATELALTSKLIDGTYPDYDRVIPKEVHFAARFRRSDLVQAVKALSSLSIERTRAVKLAFGPDAVVCSLNSPEIGNSAFRFDAEHGAPTGFSVGANGRYLLDLCGAIRGDEVEMRFTDAAAPILVVDPADTAFRAVQMPMWV